MAQPHEDEKVEAYAIEDNQLEHSRSIAKGDTVIEAYDKGQIATGYENVSIPQTILKFKMACLVCFLATFAASTDGYQSALAYCQRSRGC
jgi:hypothetical protein